MVLLEGFPGGTGDVSSRRVFVTRRSQATSSEALVECQGRWDGGKFASPDFQMQIVGAGADAPEPHSGQDGVVTARIRGPCVGV